jgi:hypothetical protein
MTTKLGTLPPSLLTLVKDNVGQAVGIARDAPAAQPFAGQIVQAANDSFVSGMHLAFTVGALVTFIAAIGVARFLPARAHDHDHDLTRSPSGDDAVPVGVTQ